MVKDFNGSYVCYKASWVFKWFWYVRWISVVGYDVFVTNSHKEAIEYIRQSKVDYLRALKHLKRF